MQLFRRIMLTAGLFAVTNVAIGSPPTNATVQPTAVGQGREYASTCQGQGTTSRDAKSSSSTGCCDTSCWNLKTIVAQLFGSGKSTDACPLAALGIEIECLKVKPTTVTTNKIPANCQACEHAVVRGHGPETTQTVKPAVAIQAIDPTRETCSDWGCIRLPSAGEIQAALRMLRGQIPSPELGAYKQQPTPTVGTTNNAKAVTVVRVPGAPQTTILPPPPPFPIAREMMPIVTPAMPMPMPMAHRIVPVATPAKHVHFASPDLEAHCERMTHRGDVVVLEGDVKLHCRKHGQSIRIDAQRVTVNMKDGTFTVESDTTSARMMLPPMMETRHMQWLPAYPGMPMMPPPPFPPFNPFSLQQMQYEAFMPEFPGNPQNRGVMPTRELPQSTPGSR